MELSFKGEWNDNYGKRKCLCLGVVTWKEVLSEGTKEALLKNEKGMCVAKES